MSAIRIAANRRKRSAARTTEKATGVRRAVEAGPSPLILIVDDVEDNREIYAEVLSRSGLRVGHASDGEHAILKVMRLLPDLVVMDLAMPILDGWEATRLIKADPKTRHIPVVAITGHTLEANKRHARDAGADAVLEKPCKPEELLSVVRKLLTLAGRESA